VPGGICPPISPALFRPSYLTRIDLDTSNIVMAWLDPMSIRIRVKMETGFTLLVFPGLDPGIAPTGEIRGDPRIKSGNDVEGTGGESVSARWCYSPFLFGGQTPGLLRQQPIHRAPHMQPSRIGRDID
jgi:hypothetical protein